MLSFKEKLDLQKIMDLYNEAFINRSYDTEVSEFEKILKSKLDNNTPKNEGGRKIDIQRNKRKIRKKDCCISNVTQSQDGNIQGAIKYYLSRESPSHCNGRSDEEISERSSILNSYARRKEPVNFSNDMILDQLDQDINTTEGFERTALPNCETTEGVHLTLSSIVDGKISTNPVRFLFKEEQCRSNRNVNKLQLRLAMNIMKQEILKHGFNGTEGISHLSKGFYFDTVTQTTTVFVMAILGLENSTKLMKILMKYTEAYESATQIKHKRIDSKSSNMVYQTQRESPGVFKTRSGRTVRTPEHITRNFVQVLNSNKRGEDVNINEVKQDIPVEPIKQLELPIFKRTYSDKYRCPTCDKIYLGDDRMNRHFKQFPQHKNKIILPTIIAERASPVQVISSSSRNRNPIFQCATCGKIYLGYRRMKKHFGKFPDHTNNEILNRILQNQETSKSKSTEDVGQKRQIRNYDDTTKEQLESEISDLNTWENMLALVKKTKPKEELSSSILLKEMEFLLKETEPVKRKAVKRAHDKDSEFKNETIEVGEDDPWQYILGIKPGTYLFVNDGDEMQSHSYELDSQLNIANQIGIETLNEALRLVEDNSLQNFLLPPNDLE